MMSPNTDVVLIVVAKDIVVLLEVSCTVKEFILLITSVAPGITAFSFKLTGYEGIESLKLELSSTVIIYKLSFLGSYQYLSFILEFSCKCS